MASDDGGRSQRKSSIQVPSLLLFSSSTVGMLPSCDQTNQLQHPGTSGAGPGRGGARKGRGQSSLPHLAGRRFAEEEGAIMATYTDQTYLCTRIKYIPVGKWSPCR